MKTSFARSVLSLGALHALSRELPIAAGASRFMRCANASSVPIHCRWSGLSVLRRPANDRAISDGRSTRSVSYVARSQGPEHNFNSAPRGKRTGPAHSPSITDQARFKRQAADAASVGMLRQRIPRQGRVSPAWPNPSIEGTCPGKPGHAPHVKRWAS